MDELGWGGLSRGTGIQCLLLGITEIGRITPRVYGDGWHSVVNQHKNLERRPYCLHRTEAHARRMVERWANANLERIRGEVSAKFARCRMHC
jgi:hypothetical protein